MSNQYAIAQALGLSQSTVSRALNNSSLIPEETRLRVQQASEAMGYQPNPMVASLMNRIRTGRSIELQGCIGIVEIKKMDGGKRPHDTWQRQHKGIVRRAKSLGFRTDMFYLSDYNMDASSLDRVFRTRGITGLILSAREANSELIQLDWSRYACSTISYTRMDINIDRVSINHRSQMDHAMEELLRRGYSRIGVCLPPAAVHGDLHGGVHGAWMDRFLFWRHLLRGKQSLPLLEGRPGDIPLSKVKQWIQKHRVDAILGLVGHEKEWLDALKLRMPKDIGLVCLNRPLNSEVSGMDENHEIVGEMTAEIVVNRILHNDLGLPPHPKLALIDGIWCEGRTLRPPC